MSPVAEGRFGMVVPDVDEAILLSDHISFTTNSPEARLPRVLRSTIHGRARGKP